LKALNEQMGVGKVLIIMILYVLIFLIEF